MLNPLDCCIAFAGTVVLAVSLAAAPAVAEEATTTQEPQVIYQTSSGEQLVCKTFAPTGTRIPREFCLTEDDWKYLREESRRVFERMLGVGTGT